MAKALNKLSDIQLQQVMNLAQTELRVRAGKKKRDAAAKIHRIARGAQLQVDIRKLSNE